MNQLWKLLAIPALVLALECHPEGPLVPRPTSLKQSATFQQALSSLASTLDAAFEGKIRAGFDVQNTSLSIGVVSVDQPDSNVPVWEYHHLSPENVNGTKSIGRHSQYLVGSISKAITDAIFLRSGLSFEDPITKYLPSLAAKESLIKWENITLGAVAGQVAGIVPNYGFSEYHYLKEFFESLGFPPIEDGNYPPCGVIGLNGLCSKQQIFDGMLTSQPIAPPETRPVYSNIAFTLLMYAVEAHTGKNYSELVSDLSTFLGMSSTLPSPGDDNLAVIPPVPNTWGSPYGENVPGGGLVSTLADLSSFLHAILSRSPALAPATRIRAWLKPHTFSGSPSTAVGYPWEIYRPPPALLFPGYNDSDPTSIGHTVTILSKDGAAYGYHARIALLDSYGLGLVILTAGDQGALGPVLDAIYSLLVPAVDAEAREQAEEMYGGTFVNEHGNATVVLDGQTMRLAGLAREGKDMLSALDQVWHATAGQFLPPEMGEVSGMYRMYPAEIEREIVGEDGRRVVEEDWRLEWGLEALRGPETDLPGRGISEGDCKSWALTDWMYYGGQSVDRLVFVRDAETGVVVGLEVPFLRTGLMRRVV